MNFFNNSEDLTIKAKKSRVLHNVVISFIIAYIMIFLGQVIGGFILGILSGILAGLNIYSDLISLLLNLFSFIFITLIVFRRVKYVEQRPISDLGLTSKNCFKNYLEGFLLGALMMSLITVILYFLGFVTIEENPIQKVGFDAIMSLIIILPGWIIQSAAEEIVARGWLMNIIGAKYTAFIGLIVSSVFFGIIHLGNPNISVLAIVNLILSGFVFGLYVMYKGDLWGACGLHASWNFVQGNIYGFEVSGLDTTIGTLIDLNLKDSYISGGIFGPEAGLVATFVEILVIIMFIILIIRKNKKIA